MIDYNENSIEPTEAEFEFPPPARFDEIASENAKPVQPIPTSGAELLFGFNMHITRGKCSPVERRRQL